MSNDTPNWMNKWQRSPRQDRRVLIDGKFVEQGPVQYPEPVQEEQQESALEVIHEAVEAVPNTDTIVPEIGAVEETDVDKEFKISLMPTIPAEAFQFIETAQKIGEEIVITGTRPPTEVLLEPSQDTAGEGVLDGQVGRTEQVEESIEDATNPVVDPASVDDLPF